MTSIEDQTERTMRIGVALGRRLALEELETAIVGLPVERVEAEGPIGGWPNDPTGYVEVIGRSAVIDLIQSKKRALRGPSDD